MWESKAKSPLIVTWTVSFLRWCSANSFLVKLVNIFQIRSNIKAFIFLITIVSSFPLAIELFSYEDAVEPEAVYLKMR